MRTSVREAISSSVVAMKAWFSSMPFFRDWIFSANWVMVESASFDFSVFSLIINSVFVISLSHLRSSSSMILLVNLN